MPSRIAHWPGAIEKGHPPSGPLGGAAWVQANVGFPLDTFSSLVFVLDGSK